MYEYFEKACIANTNLYNRALFVCRQVLSGLGKEPEQRQKNEREVLAEIEKELPKMQETRKKGGSFGKMKTILHPYFRGNVRSRR